MTLTGDVDFPMMLEVEAGLHVTVPPVSVGFGLGAVLDHEKTAKAGHEVYADIPFVKIAIPGDRNSLYFQPATEAHKKRFPKAWADFQTRSTNAPRNGLPIEQWAPISRATALTLRAANIHTVEDLAAVHDGHVDRIGSNGRTLREQAKAFLEQAKNSAAVTAAAAEKKALQDQLKALQDQILALSSGAAKQAPTASVAPVDDGTDSVADDVVAAARRPRARA